MDSPAILVQNTPLFAALLPRPVGRIMNKEIPGQGVIVADVGGTNGRFAVASMDAAGQHVLSHQHTYNNEELGNFEQLLALYLEELGSRAPVSACFATAGPNDGRRGLLTNRGWELDAEALEKRFELEHVLFVNDFKALACTVPDLPDSGSVLLNGVAAVTPGPVCVMGPGTGLGVALVVNSSAGHITVSTEGGHMAFAPTTDLELRLRDYVARTHEHVYTELFLSGDGLRRIYSFLCEEEGIENEILTAAQVTAGALGGEDERCLHSIQIFLSILGSVAGDLALAHGALGGVYIGGGIVPRIQPLLGGSDLCERFSAKGRMREYLSGIPLRLITAENIALRGAARLYDQQYS
jgi:glucokinase